MDGKYVLHKSKKKMKQLMRILILSILLINSINHIGAVSLDSCYTLARRNYPLIKQLDLISKSEQYSVENVSKGFLPQISVYGQATYQSEVTKVPISLPALHIPEMSKDQYKIYAEVVQPLTDIKTVSDQRRLTSISAQTDISKTEIELYKIRERINGIYFGILLMRGQLIQLNLIRSDLDAANKKIQVGINNGTTLKSVGDQMEVEILRNEQKVNEIKSGILSYFEMLRLFTGLPVDTTMEMQLPSTVENTSNNRPELNYYSLQLKSIDIQNSLLSDRNIPRFSLFLQAGYGRPALNMLNNDFKTFYVGGVRLNWNISSYYTLGNDKEVLNIARKNVATQKELFLFNSSVSMKQQDIEALKLKSLLETDNRIIELRVRIKKSIQLQLENGTATTTDFLNAVNAEEQARQNYTLHQIQLQMTNSNARFINGN